MTTSMGAIHLCSSRAHADLGMLACAASMGPDDQCVIIDDREGARRARDLGLRVDAHIAPPLRRPWLARRTLRILLRESHHDQRAIIAWGAHLEPLASATRGEQIVVDLSKGVIERFPGSLRGPGPIRTLATPAVPLLPPTDPALRSAIRTRMALAPNERAIALAGVCQSECDVPAFVHVLGMLHFANIPVVGVVDRGQMSRHRAAMRRAREAMPQLRVLVRDEPMLNWIGACDAAVLAPGDRFSTAETRRRFDASLLARTIAATGVRIIVNDGDAADAVVARNAPDAPSARVIRVESAHPATMARALRSTLEDAAASAEGDAPPSPHASPHTQSASPAGPAWRAALAAIADPAPLNVPPGLLSASLVNTPDGAPA